MSFLSRLFSKEKDDFETINQKLSIEEPSEPWSFDQLSLCNFDRVQYTYHDLKRLGWWPDQLIQWVEVNRIAYIDVMHLHSKYSSDFDQPLRDLIDWLKTTKLEDPDLETEKQNFFDTESSEIQTRYWTHVLREDNCYMYQLEDFSAKRSDQESKHYKLFRLTKKLLFEGAYNDPKLKIYVSLYDLRGAHARTDDLFRKALWSFCTDETFTFVLNDITEGLSTEIDELIQFCHDVPDFDIIEKLTVFTRIMKYMHFGVRIFQESMFGSLGENTLEDGFCDNLSSLKKTYHYFLKRIEQKTFHDSLILKGSSVGTIMDLKRLTQFESATMHSVQPVTPRPIISRRRSRSFSGTKK